MSKFRKRLQKVLGDTENALILGDGFSSVQDLCVLFQTVFVINPTWTGQKYRNLIYREDFGDLVQLPRISTVFLSPKDSQMLDAVAAVLNRWRPMVVIEGNEVIDRDKSKCLYENHYLAFSQNGSFHIWTCKP